MGTSASTLRFYHDHMDMQEQLLEEDEGILLSVRLREELEECRANRLKVIAAATEHYSIFRTTDPVKYIEMWIDDGQEAQCKLGNHVPQNLRKDDGSQNLDLPAGASNQPHDDDIIKIDSATPKEPEPPKANSQVSQINSDINSETNNLLSRKTKRSESVQELVEYFTAFCKQAELDEAQKAKDAASERPMRISPMSRLSKLLDRLKRLTLRRPRRRVYRQLD